MTKLTEHKNRLITRIAQKWHHGNERIDKIIKAHPTNESPKSRRRKAMATRVQIVRHKRIKGLIERLF